MQLCERLASLGIMGAQLWAPWNPLYITALSSFDVKSQGNNALKTCSCLGDWRVFGVMGAQLRAPVCHSAMVLKGLRGAPTWAPHYAEKDNSLGKRKCVFPRAEMALLGRRIGPIFAPLFRPKEFKHYSEKTMFPFPFKLNGIWSWWQFSFLF